MSAPFAPSLRARLRRRAGRHGVALLLVLGCLVLLTTLILAFLISGQANLKSSKLYANGSSVKTLADSTVSLVMAQIQQATSNGTQVAWASQPGMIRTYDNTGAPLTNYRLFSWDSPTVSGAYDASTDATQLSSTPSTIVWYNSPSVFVDLNRPVNDSTGVPHYPILDGNPKDLVSYTTPAGTAASTYTINSITPGIEGFWVNLPNATGTSSMGPAVNPTTSTPSNGNTNDVPMPVKWLYVLKDGTVVAPAPSSTGSTVSIPSATSTNPIVGRIAYWTDDETAKVNINTASEGVYWDTPRADTTYERTSLANFQPAQNEFQRYPGHPATTCLSTVLGALFPVSHDGSTYTASQFMPYFTLAPKSNVGGITQNANLGSNAGTAAPVTGTKAAQTGAGALSFKSKERLYASVDELNFQSDLPNGLPSPLPGNAGVSAGSGYSRTSTANGADNVIAAADIGSSPFLEKAHFFLTADSRAPDVNLYNQPRLSIWPVSATNTTSARTGFDTTIAFCGTINKLPYYFQRQNSFDPSADLPTSYTAGDSGIGRNRQLIKYLQSVTGGTNGGVSIPGFGGDFVTKYTSSERDQILTEIFDYVRCQNLIDPNVSTPFSGTPSFGLNYLGTTDYTNHSGSGQVVPIVDTLGAGGAGTRGFGRFPTVTEADLVFIVEGWNDNSGGSPATTDPNYWSPGSSSISATSPTGSPWGYYGKATMTGTPPTSTLPNCWSFKNHVLVMAPIQPGHVRVQAALILSLFDPSQGYPANNGCYQVGIQGLDSWTWNGVTMNFPSESDALTNWPIESGSKFGYDQVKWGGIMDYRHLIMDMSPTAAKNSSQYYPFFSDSIDIPYDPTKSASATNPTPITFTAGGNPITIKVYVPTGTSWKAGTLLQTIKVTFPDGVFPCPTYAGPVQDDNGVHDMARWDVRFAQGPNPWSPQTFLFVSKGVALTQAVDVVRSVRLNTDARLVAGLQTVDASATSAPNGSYFASYTGSETTNLIHGLWLSTGMPLFGATWGQLVPGLTYNTTYSSPWTANLGNVGALLSAGYCPTQGAYSTDAAKNPILGDWDNGVGVAVDGPYINKADEGDYQYWDGSNATVPYFDTWYSSTALSNAGQTFFSPNRLMPSAVMFGSLPTGVERGIPWQTLLFNPVPAGGNTHPGFGVGSGTQGFNDVPPYRQKPPDHLLLDLFTMPIVEPYPISEPLSTAGRINMNTQIVPFTYIERNTGVRAVLKSERIIAIPDTDAGKYKNMSGTSVSYTANNYRLPINLDATLSEFDSYFSTNKDIFRSASQVCNIPLVPSQDVNGNGISLPFDAVGFWSTHRLTGDNSREKPYADIYPRLTTKSDTFMVHYDVQTLQKVTSSDPTVWDEAKDQVTGEYRGSTTIERYVDPNDTTLPDFADPSNATVALDKWYKFRVVSNKQFAP